MNAIFCTYNNSFIGIKNKLPWELIQVIENHPVVQFDKKIFREVTRGGTVVMGRKTWESMGSKPLSGRYNIIITSEPEKMAAKTPLYSFNKDVVNYLTIEQFEKILPKLNNVWIIGGVSLFERYIPKCELVYETMIYIGERLLKHFSDEDFVKIDRQKLLKNGDFIVSDHPESYKMRKNLNNDIVYGTLKVHCKNYLKND